MPFSAILANFGRFARKFVNLLWPNRFSYESEIFRKVFWLSKIARKIIRSNLSARTWKLWWFKILKLACYIWPPSHGATCLFLGTSHIIGVSISIIKRLATIAIYRTEAIQSNTHLPRFVLPPRISLHASISGHTCMQV